MDQVRQRGLSAFTLVETLVASAVLVGLAAILLIVYTVSLRAREKEDAHTVTYRSCMLALEQIRESLRGCRLLEPTDVDAAGVSQARFQYPVLKNGVMQVDARGEPEWAGTALIATDAEGNLTLTYPDGGVRMLARLGLGGSAIFRRLDERMVEVAVLSVRDHPSDVTRRSRYELRARLTLPNQP